MMVTYAAIWRIYLPNFIPHFLSKQTLQSDQRPNASHPIHAHFSLFLADCCTSQRLTPVILLIC